MSFASPAPSRRDLMSVAAALGFGSAAFHRALASETATAAQPAGGVTAEMVKNAEWVAGIELTDAQRATVASGMTRTLREIAGFHQLEVGNHVPPAVHFLPKALRVGSAPTPKANPEATPAAAIERPAKDEDLAFLPLSQLATLVKARKATSVELTKLYLARLKQYDPALKCVVTLTEELALKQAEAADKEIAVGKYRGPLHGIPWGAKDLIAYPRYRTTWGAAEFKDRILDTKAAVAERLEATGAVLVAKLSLGTLALGDIWFEGMTRNPWNVKQGSSGSSAGSASAVAAGLVGFAIGSETNGSIVSPCTRCGTTGLRPTFGRVSRHGCMTLSWSMDKLGPIARSVEDCAWILQSIHGADERDLSTVSQPFEWPCRKELKDIRVGYVEGTKDEDRAELKVLKQLGVKLVPITLPTGPAAAVNGLTINVEASAAFDDLTRAGKLTQIGGFWPRIFQSARFVSATDYLRAQRVRTLLMRDMANVMEQVDLYVGVFDLYITNLTGHPTVVMPNGLVPAGKDVQVPTAITFTGRLFGESELLAVAKAYQEATGHHRKHPDMSQVTKDNAGIR